MAKAAVTVLASGGLDSTACLSYYLAESYDVNALWIDYGQPAARAEEGAIGRITDYYEIPLQKVFVAGLDWPIIRSGELFEFRGRNLTLVALALNTAKKNNGLLALGIHRGAPFSDCSTTFAQQLGDLVAFLSNGCLRLDCPFLHWSKLEIAKYAEANAVPIHLTYSCERGSVPPCKECVKCRDAQEILNAL
jgi:7-cyano-7-deazaguanine synthase